MKSVLFVDPVCPDQYSPLTLDMTGAGGTEATVCRIAEELAKTVHVTVMQHCRKVGFTSETGARYVGPGASIFQEKFDAIVVLRMPQVALNLRKVKPDTRMYLWLHDIQDQSIRDYAPLLANARIPVIPVSGWHLMQIVELLNQDKDNRPVFPMFHTIYNPVADHLVPDSTPVDKNKLVFFSSPHKGLDYALSTFKNLRNFNPDFKLYVANPGYFKDADTSMHPNVVNLGSIPHHKVMQHVREALCVYYPNHVYPETFGLVLAEANAVGTPVITHGLGAAHEVLNGNWQLVDTRNVKVMFDKIMSWHASRPQVTGRGDFKLSKIVERWKKVLNV